MAHSKRVINFALFFFALFNSANIACPVLKKVYSD